LLWRLLVHDVDERDPAGSTSGRIAEPRRALLEVGAHRFALILATRDCDLELGLETKAIGDAAEQRGVEELLRGAHRVGTALGDLARERVRVAVRVVAH